MDNDSNVPAEDENQPTEEAVEEQPEGDEPEAEPENLPEEQEEPAKPREAYSMPVAKAQKEKQRAVERAKAELAEEYEAKIAELKAQSKPESEAKTDMIEKVASEHGLDPKAAKEFAEAIIRQVEKPDMSKYDQLLEDRKIEKAKAEVSTEFDEKVLPLVLKDNPHATPEHLAKVKAKITELAFTEGYNAYRVEDIYKVKSNEFTFQNEMGAESPKGHGQQIAPFKVLSDEDEIKLADNDPSAYERYLKWLEGQESKFIE